MPRFNLERFVNSSRQKIFDVATNCQNYEQLLSKYFPSVRILSSRDNVSVVEEHMNLGNKELVMMTKHVVEYPFKHEVFVIGGDAKGTHIIETFEELPQGTRFNIEVDLKLKGSLMIMGLLGKHKIYGDYSKIVDEIVSVAEF